MIEFDVKANTIVSNLEIYVNKGNKLNSKNIYKLLTCPSKIKKNVYTEYKLNEKIRLKTLFEKFEGKISYDELHLIRILYKTLKLGKSNK